MMNSTIDELVNELVVDASYLTFVLLVAVAAVIAVVVVGGTIQLYST